MQYLLTTFDDGEDILAKECEELNFKAKILTKGRVLVEGDLDISKIQTAMRAFKVLNQIQFSTIEDILKIDIQGEFKAVECFRGGNQNFTSQEVRNSFVKKVILNKEVKETLGIDIKDSYCTVGVLLSEKKLSTRKHMVRIHRFAVPPLIAALAIHYSQFDKDIPIVDPMCLDGSMVIEAANAGFKVKGFDRENEIRNAKINVYMAKVSAEVEIGSVNNVPEKSQVITRPFEFFSKMKPKKVEEKLRVLLENLNKKQVSRVTLIMSHPGTAKNAIANSNFSLIKEKIIRSGELEWNIFVLSSEE